MGIGNIDAIQEGSPEDGKETVGGVEGSGDAVEIAKKADAGLDRGQFNEGIKKNIGEYFEEELGGERRTGNAQALKLEYHQDFLATAEKMAELEGKLSNSKAVCAIIGLLMSATGLSLGLLPIPVDRSEVQILGGFELLLFVALAGSSYAIKHYSGKVNELSKLGY
jgi:uncharacterized MAPEG superfamily protein